MRSTFSMADEYITMTRGDTIRFGMEVLDGDGQGIELDTAYFSCKKSLSDTEYVFQKSLEDGIYDNGDGEYVVRIAPEDTEDLEAGKYHYDLQLGVDQDIFTAKIGILEIDADVTR